MEFTYWYIAAGAVLIAMAMAGTSLKRLPLTASLLYLLIGVGLGPWGAGLIRLDPVRSSGLLERLTEFAILASLFTAGLKLRTPLADRRWLLPVRLASVSMMVTVGLVAAIGTLLLGMPPGEAVLLGAILAPTDPVLASDVQVAHATDSDRLRFGLTGEAGLNDGTAFPLVILGLGLMGLHGLGEAGWRWLTLDVLWALAAGLGVGGIAGTLVGRLVIHLRREHKEAVGLDEFLSLGLLASSYGLALLIHGYGFLAAFAAGVALRRVESLRGDVAEQSVHVDVPAAAGAADEVATDARKAPAYMAQAVLGFNEQLERICEVAVVVVLGGMLSTTRPPREALWFVPLLFLVIRPLAVALGTLGASITAAQRGMTCWFGIRGVGSIYYLAYAVQHGVTGEPASRVAALTLSTVAASIVVHGVSVTPLMKVYERRAGGRRSAARVPTPAQAEEGGTRQ